MMKESVEKCLIELRVERDRIIGAIEQLEILLNAPAPGITRMPKGSELPTVRIVAGRKKRAVVKSAAPIFCLVETCIRSKERPFKAPIGLQLHEQRIHGHARKHPTNRRPVEERSLMSSTLGGGHLHAN